MKQRMIYLFIGALMGATLFGRNAVHAAELYLKAYPSAQAIYLDGERVELEAYTINGSNYVKLRDVGEAVGFNVYWDGAVQIDSDAPYTGEAPGDSTNAAPSQQNAGLYAVRVEIVERVNALRQNQGLPALRMDDYLMTAAQVRADEIAANLAYRHERPDGSRIDTVVSAAGNLRMGENIGSKDYRGMELAELARIQTESWQASEAHYRNLLRAEYHSTGVGIGRDKFGRYFLVQLFAAGDYTILRVDHPILP